MGCTRSRQQIQTPWELSSLTKREWIEWKKCFYTYLDQKLVPKNKQISKFFKYIGFLGDEIANNVYYQDNQTELDLETLIFKFDIFFIFGVIKKQSNQSIKQYIRCLKVVAECTTNDHVNIEKMIKEKVLQEFKSTHIFEHIQKLSVSSRVIDYENLNLSELVFFWKLCTRISNNICYNCGKSHKTSRCYALNQKCWKCKELNHFARCCPKLITRHCNKCGTNHLRKKCPASNKECSRCKQMNHFSWKCKSESIQSCIFCGLTHVSNRRYCGASGSKCYFCGEIGHFSNKCLYRKNMIQKRYL